MNLVIDASVLIKAFIPEQGSEEAAALLERTQATELVLLAPQLIYSELANILWKKARRGELTPAEAREIAEALLAVPLQTEPTAATMRLALDLALLYGITAYDAHYLALAEIFACPLLTADHKLAHLLTGTGFADRIRTL